MVKLRSDIALGLFIIFTSVSFSIIYFIFNEKLSLVMSIFVAAIAGLVEYNLLKDILNRKEKKGETKIWKQKKK